MMLSYISSLVLRNKIIISGLNVPSTLLAGLLQLTNLVLMGSAHVRPHCSGLSMALHQHTIRSNVNNIAQRTTQQQHNNQV